MPHRNLPIPTYRVDLAVAPEDRYETMATELAGRMRGLMPLLDEIMEFAIPWPFVRKSLKVIGKTFLHRLHSTEQTRELRGISRITGIPMYLLVILNVLLDSLMGCTSGAALVCLDTESRYSLRSRPSATVPPRTRMDRHVIDTAGLGETSHPHDPADTQLLHFRTLDWGMDGLRRLLVVLEFVDSSSPEPDYVIARSITYAGFVGVLTGVRENLSLSLNFRPNHIGSTIALRAHQAMVWLGLRPSIASQLRDVLLSEHPHTQSLQARKKESRSGSLAGLAAEIAPARSSPCYIFLCDGHLSVVIEKDIATGVFRQSAEFLVHTNHDIQTQSRSEKHRRRLLAEELWLEESQERMDAIVKKWTDNARWCGLEAQDNLAQPVRKELAVTEKRLAGWVNTYPIMNECSHFGCILDPKTGTIKWMARGLMKAGEVPS